jgi:TolB protein
VYGKCSDKEAPVHRLVFITVALGLGAVVAAVNAPSQRAAATKVRNGKISFWSDRAFGGRAQVFVMNPNGARQRRLTKLFSAKRGDFSPDGKRLVFDGRARETLDNFDIFVMNADGTGLRQLTRGPERDTQASWSPDGRLVSVVRVENESAAPSIWIVAAEGNNAHRIAAGGSAAWAPNGKRLAVGGFGLTLMNPDGSGARTIVTGERARPRPGRETAAASSSRATAAVTLTSTSSEPTARTCGG